LGHAPGHLPVVEQLEHRVELLVGLERPVLDRTIRQVAACPAVRAAVTADPQPAEVLGDHGEGAWLDVPGGEQEECLVVRVAGPGQLEQPVVGEDAAFAGCDGQCGAAEDVVQHAIDHARQLRPQPGRDVQPAGQRPGLGYDEQRRADGVGEQRLVLRGGSRDA
jgi:hypothetical protein